MNESGRESVSPSQLKNRSFARIRKRRPNGEGGSSSRRDPDAEPCRRVNHVNPSTCVRKVHRVCTYPGRTAVAAVHCVHAEGRVAMASRRRCLGNGMLFHYS